MWPLQGSAEPGQPDLLIPEILEAAAERRQGEREQPGLGRAALRSAAPRLASKRLPFSSQGRDLEVEALSVALALLQRPMLVELYCRLHSSAGLMAKSCRRLQAELASRFRRRRLARVAVVVVNEAGVDPAVLKALHLSLCFLASVSYRWSGIWPRPACRAQSALRGPCRQ